jgi:hypothetical protein
MATKVVKSTLVNVPVETAYAQWTQFEEFPYFMDGVAEVRQLDETTLQWVAVIGGVKRQWRAVILEQIPNEKVAWAATEGTTNAGAVYFTPAGSAQTMVELELEYEPEGVIETVADKVGLVERHAERDLERFKAFIEDAGYASGAWRGTVPGAVGTPGVEAAATSKGDSGGAGVAKKVVAGAAVAAAAGVAAAAKAKSGGSDSDTESEREIVVVETEVPVTDTVAPVAPVPADRKPVDPVPVDSTFPADPQTPTLADLDRDRRA